jgi:hypothetical protein
MMGMHVSFHMYAAQFKKDKIGQKSFTVATYFLSLKPWQLVLNLKYTIDRKDKYIMQATL